MNETIQMVRYENGEVRVIDTARMIASDFLAASEQNAPLADYELDHELTAADLKTPYTVVR